MKQPTLFYNTTNQSGEALAKEYKNCNKQELSVLSLFMANPTEFYTPFEVQRQVMRNSPVTSTRRAMTNLTQKGYLIKTNKQKQGEFGKPNYCWTLNHNQ